jgi:hypothetical protein
MISHTFTRRQTRILAPFKTPVKQQQLWCDESQKCILLKRPTILHGIEYPTCRVYVVFLFMLFLRLRSTSLVDRSFRSDQLKQQKLFGR